MIVKRSYLLLGLVLLLPLRLRAQEPTGREIMEAYEAQDRTDDLSAELAMTLVAARGGTREREVTLVTKTAADGTRKQLIRFRSPADVAGTGFLSIENRGRADDNWLFLPALRKTRRIAGTDRQDSFMGTDFTYEDLEAEQLDDYTYERTGTEQIAGTDAWIVEARPASPDKAAETGYAKRALWISKDRGLLLQAKFYDKDGAYVKRLSAEDLRQVPGTERWRPYRLVMEDVRSGSRTILAFSNYRIDEGVPDDTFTQRYLERGR